MDISFLKEDAYLLVLHLVPYLLTRPAIAAARSAPPAKALPTNASPALSSISDTPTHAYNHVRLATTPT